MTERQRARLEAAERVCDLVSRDEGAGFDDRPYCPSVVAGLHVMQRRAEQLGELPQGSCHPLGELAREVEKAVHRWLSLVGKDPATYAKANARYNSMALVKEALGPGYEAEFEQLPTAKFLWPEQTADERAARVAQEILSGKIRGFAEARIAIAGELLEAESKARQPFLDLAEALFKPIVDAHNAGAELPADASERWSEATGNFFRASAVYFPEFVRVERPIASTEQPSPATGLSDSSTATTTGLPPKENV